MVNGKQLHGSVTVQNPAGRDSLHALVYSWGFAGSHLVEDHLTFAYDSWWQVEPYRRLTSRSLRITDAAGQQLVLGAERHLLDALHDGWARYQEAPASPRAELIAWELEYWRPKLKSGSDTDIESAHVVAMIDRRDGMGPGHAVTSVFLVTSGGVLWSAIDGSTIRNAIVWGALGAWRAVQRGDSRRFALLTLEGEVDVIASKEDDSAAIEFALRAQMSAS